MSILCYFVNLESFVEIKNRSRQKRNVDKRNVHKRQYKSKKNNKPKSKSNSKSKSKSNSIVNINQKQDACENKIANIKVEVETCSSNLTTANQQVETCSSNLTTANQKADTCLTNLQTANEQVETCSSNLTTANQQVNKYSIDLQTANQQVKTCSDDLSLQKTCSSDLTKANLKLKFMNAYNAEIIDSIKLKQLLEVLNLIYVSITTPMTGFTSPQVIINYKKNIIYNANNILSSIVNKTDYILQNELTIALQYELAKNSYIDRQTLENVNNIYNNKQPLYVDKSQLIELIQSYINKI